MLYVLETKVLIVLLHTHPHYIHFTIKKPKNTINTKGNVFTID